jgi:16S rRNA processing protein RimM
MGKVVGPHGLEGLLRVFSFAESDASFADVNTVFLRSSSGEIGEFAVASVRPHKHVVLMKLNGVSNRREAEKHRGEEVLILREAVHRESDEYFWQDLLGIKVYLESGEYLGELFQIIPTAANDIYVVRRGHKEILLPATYEVVKEIRVENRKMTISETEGLMSLNEV